MSQEYQFIKLSPDAYEKIQHEISSGIARDRALVNKYNQTIDANYQEIEKLEAQIIAIKERISQIQANTKQCRQYIITKRRALKVDTNFLSKLNRRVNKDSLTVVNVEKKLIKRR